MRHNGAITADGAVTASNISGSTSGTNTGDQTSIVGITGTLAQFNAALTGADFASGGGTATGTNTGDQTVANTSDATSHTVTLSASGGSVQLVEGTGITLTTTGTGLNGIVTVASTVTASPGGSDGQIQYNNGGVFGGASDFYWDDVNFRVGIGTSAPTHDLHISRAGNAAIRLHNTAVSNAYSIIYAHNDGGLIGVFACGSSGATTPAYANRLFMAGVTGFGYLGLTFDMDGGDVRWYKTAGSIEVMRLTNAGDLLINSTTAPASMTAGIAIKTGTAPSGDVADQFSAYSADQAAGNACFHTRTELGHVVKLFRGAALTAQDTTITHTAPGTPDFAIQDLTNVAPFGFVTQDEGNTVLQVIANLQTRVAELEARLNVATGHGLIA